MLTKNKIKNTSWAWGILLVVYTTNKSILMVILTYKVLHAESSKTCKTKTQGRILVAKYRR